jgi:succinate dehydrogenase / fumarate reductase membrane anchor subunit
VNTLASGLRAWVVQRITALYMLLFVVFVLGRLAVDAPGSYAAWRAWIASGTMRLATLVFFAALLLHAWVGLRDVVMDYVHPLPARLLALALAALGLSATGAWALRVLLLA